MSTTVRPARRHATAAAGLTLVAGLALTACSAGDSSGSTGDSAAGGSTVEQSAPRGAPDLGGEAAAEAPQDGSKNAGTGTSTTVDFAASTRKLARRADISVTVPDVDAAAAKVRSIAAGVKGMVTAEAISSEPEAMEYGGFSTITISVPTTSLDATLDQLAEIGEVQGRHTSTDDVTTQYVDTASRIETMTSSVERVRALMGQATRLADIVTLEAELSRRQADLEAMQTQLNALEGQVATAPIEVRLSTDAKVLEEPEEATGFLAGLKSGWAAFAASVTVVLTVLGATLPFLIAFAIVLVPFLVWLRRRGAADVTPPVAPAPPAA